MTFSRKKLDTQILKSVFSDTLISHILCLLEKIIASSSPTTVPPLNDITPFFYYVVPSTDTTRSLIHVSLACWNTENHLQAALLNALDPLYREYIARHPQPELDAYGAFPPLDVVALYLKSVSECGFTNYHQDDTNKFHPFQLLALLHDPFNHSFLSMILSLS